MTRFLVINDLHAQFAPGAEGHAGYGGANRRAEWLLGELARPGAFGGLDFVVSAGDLIHGEDLAAIAAEIPALHARLAALPMPVYPCVGNHEIKQAEGDDAFEAPFRQTFKDQMDYVFAAGPVDVVVMNNAGSFHVTRERREARYGFLRNALRADPARPKILVCHIPLVPLRDPAVLRNSFGFISWRCLEAELIDLLDAAGQTVRLVISGHLHLTGMVERLGVHHVAASGLASLPHDLALVTVTSDRIEVGMVTPPADLHDPGTNIHGQPRFKVDYVDATHPDHATYLRGTPAERRFSVPL
ncbi:MAG: metallophosphoesterase [Lentisphaerae bacterium]|nr:metallophosphoesterase [Lentisphaerota bacterium]